MNLAGFVQRLVIPEGFTPPSELVTDDLRATPITRDDLADDVAGINASLDTIRRTRGGRWPTGPVTEEGNYVDLVWHEAEHRDGTSYTYVIRDRDGGYLGCFYLYPLGRRQPLTEELLDHDVDVSWWVTQTAYEQGWYAKVHAALLAWTVDRFPFTNPHVSNVEIPT